MGALYWQLNDIWPGASWTSLEYGGALCSLFTFTPDCLQYVYRELEDATLLC